MTDRSRRNEALARRLWQGASTGDPAPFLELAPDIAWRTYGTGPNAGEFKGLDEVLKYLAETGQRPDAMRSELIDVFASDDGAVLLYRSTFQHGSRVLEGRYFLWLRIEDDVICEVVAVPWDQAAADAFWKPH